MFLTQAVSTGPSITLRCSISSFLIDDKTHEFSTPLDETSNTMCSSMFPVLPPHFDPSNLFFLSLLPSCVIQQRRTATPSLKILFGWGSSKILF